MDPEILEILTNMNLRHLEDVIKHHLYEHQYCSICERQTLSQQMDDCKATFLEILHMACKNPDIQKTLDLAAGR